MKTPISICIIAKNEEKNMEAFLSSIQKCMGDYPHEILICDTGSSDRTVEIAKSFGCKIVFFEWIGDFAAARNHSIDQASHDYILVLDCDEYSLEIDSDCFDLFIHQYPKAVGLLTRHNHNEVNGTDSIYTDRVERFFDRRLYHYEAIIHEQVRLREGASAWDREQYTRVDLPVKVDHIGYCSSPEELKAKVKRNNDLLFQMLEDNPEDPYLYFQIGQSFNMLHDDENAVRYYGKGLEFDVDPRAEYVQMMVNAYGYCLLHLGRIEEALAFEGIYEEFAVTADFVVLMGLIYMRNGKLLEAMKEFLKATTMTEYRVDGSNSFIPLFNMGCINEGLGNLEDAINLYKACGDFAPAKARIRELTK